jgi:hypothetical protein
MKWALTYDLLGKDFRLQNNKNLGGYSDDFLGSVFEPNELAPPYSKIDRKLRIFHFGRIR